MQVLAKITINTYHLYIYQSDIILFTFRKQSDVDREQVEQQTCRAELTHV